MNIYKLFEKYGITLHEQPHVSGRLGHLVKYVLKSELEPHLTKAGVEHMKIYDSKIYLYSASNLLTNFGIKEWHNEIDHEPGYVPRNSNGR